MMTESACSWRRPVILLAVSLLTAALGFAVRYGEDNQIMESNVGSFYVFVLAGVIAYWAILRLMIILVRHLKKHRE